MLNDLSFLKGQGGLNRPLPGQDFISGLIYYTGTLPAGFSAGARIRKFFSITDAENAGIKADYNDETPATGTLTITAVGANGDSITPMVAETFGKSVALGTYVKVIADATPTAVATGLAKAINASTKTTGYSATSNAAVVTITARKGLGIFLNSNAPLSTTIVGAIAATVGAFAGGVVSLQSVYHYHILRFFLRQPNQQGTLYVGFFAVPNPYTFAEITTVQNFAGGLIRQMGVYKDSAAYTTADLTAIQVIKTALDTAKKPLSILYAADISAVEDLTTIGDLSLLTASGVSDCISQDGAVLGAALFYAYGKSITNLGDELGCVALAKVSEDIAWVTKFNVSDGAGAENDVLAFANGVLYTDASISDALLSELNDQRHIFLRKFTGQDGSYWNDSHTAIAQNSDYAYIEDNRTIDKADRLIYTNVLPALNGPIQENADGTLSDNSIASFTTLAEAGLDQMVRNGELSGRAVTIDPNQNLNTAGKLIIAAKLLQEGVARNIQVNVGFTNSLS